MSYMISAFRMSSPSFVKAAHIRSSGRALSCFVPRSRYPSLSLYASLGAKDLDAETVAVKTTRPIPTNVTLLLSHMPSKLK